jgi:hypothetical protein
MPSKRGAGTNLGVNRFLKQILIQKLLSPLSRHLAGNYIFFFNNLKKSSLTTRMCIKNTAGKYMSMNYLTILQKGKKCNNFIGWWNSKDKRMPYIDHYKGSNLQETYKL